MSYQKDMAEPLRSEFAVHRLNPQGLERAETLARAFGVLLDCVEVLVPPGRERALVVTKLQEASFFAKRGIAVLPENQVPTPNTSPTPPAEVCVVCGITTGSASLCDVHDTDNNRAIVHALPRK